MVEQLGIGRPHVAVTCLTHLDAKIDIVKRHREGLVEASDLEIQRLAHHEASAGNGGEILHKP